MLSRSRHFHGFGIHSDLNADKIWIQHDGVATELIEVGISPQQIVLAFRSEGERRQDIFAVNQSFMLYVSTSAVYLRQSSGSFHKADASSQ